LGLAKLAVDCYGLASFEVYMIANSNRDESIEERVGRLLQTQQWTLATAESCSGGLIAHRVTNIPGSSGYFLGGVVTYSNEAKQGLLGVPADILETEGAVSESVARAMAQGVCKRFDADIGVGVTGIAGPGGGTVEKPVGLVYIAVTRWGATEVRQCVFNGTRANIKKQTAETALTMIEEQLA
jgi:nicotinamide-nucleotide amidase